MAIYDAPESLHVGNGVETVFGFNWPYLLPRDLTVTVNGMQVPTVLAAPYQVSITPAPAALSVVRIYRNTPAQNPLYLFATGIPMLPKYIDGNNKQLLYALQEGLLQFARTQDTADAALAAAEAAQLLAEQAAESAAEQAANIRRTVRVTGADPELLPLPSVAARSLKVMGFDSLGNPVGVLPATGSGTELALDLASVTPGKGGSMVGYKYPNERSVQRNVGSRLADSVSVFDFIPVAQHAAIRAGTSTYDISPHLRDLVDVRELDFGPRGNVFQMNSAVVFPRGVCFHGEATIKVPLTDRAFDLVPATVATYTIASRGADVVYPAYGGNLVTPLVIENPTGLRRGDIVQISCEDIYGFSTGARKAELMRVLEVVGTTVYLHGYLEDVYPTTPILTKLSTEQYHVGDLTFTSQSDPYAMLTGSALGVVRAVGVAHFTCSATFERLGGAGLNLTSCWMPAVDVQCRDLRDKLAINAYGYGVIAYGCTRYAQIKIRAERVRHAYTGGVINNPPTVMHRGTVRNTRCYDSLGVNTTAASFDTHPGEYDAQFTSCHAVFRNGDADATTSQAPGFQDRGCDTVFTACTVQGVGHGFELAGMRELHGKSNVTRLYDCWVQAGKQLATPAVLTMRTKLAPEACEVRIYGGGLDGGAGGAVLGLEAATADLELQGTALYNITTMRLGAGNNARIIGCSRRNTGTAEPIIVGINGSLIIDKYTAEAAAYSQQHLVRVGLTGETGTATVHVGSMSAVNRSSAVSPVGTNGVATVDLRSISVYPLRSARGNTAGRPALNPSDVGYVYFDTTLNKPIWWSSVAWVDGTGAVV